MLLFSRNFFLLGAPSIFGAFISKVHCPLNKVDAAFTCCSRCLPLLSPQYNIVFSLDFFQAPFNSFPSSAVAADNKREHKYPDLVIRHALSFPPFPRLLVKQEGRKKPAKSRQIFFLSGRTSSKFQESAEKKAKILCLQVPLKCHCQ